LQGSGQGTGNGLTGSMEMPEGLAKVLERSNSEKRMEKENEDRARTNLAIEERTKAISNHTAEELADQDAVDRECTDISILNPKLTKASLAQPGFLQLGRYDGMLQCADLDCDRMARGSDGLCNIHGNAEHNGTTPIKQGGLAEFLRRLGPPLSYTEEGQKVSEAWYQKIYAQCEAVREQDECISYWHLLETLIIARLGLDALPDTGTAQDRGIYMKRVVRVIKRTDACEKIQAAWRGKRFRLVELPKHFAKYPPEGRKVCLETIARARNIVVTFRQKDFENKRSTDDTRKELKVVWEPSVKFSVKHCGHVKMINVDQGLETLGKKGMISIAKDHAEDSTLFRISHPIVLIKHYQVKFTQMPFDKHKMALSIERILQYTEHDTLIKDELTEIVISLLISSGILEPFVLDLRMMLAKVLLHTVL